MSKVLTVKMTEQERRELERRAAGRKLGETALAIILGNEPPLALKRNSVVTFRVTPETETIIDRMRGETPVSEFLWRKLRE